MNRIESVRMDYIGLEREGLKSIENVVIGKYQIGKDCSERTGLGRIELKGIKWNKEYIRLKIF